MFKDTSLRRRDREREWERMRERVSERAKRREKARHPMGFEPTAANFQSANRKHIRTLSSSTKQHLSQLSYCAPQESAFVIWPIIIWHRDNLCTNLSQTWSRGLQSRPSALPCNTHPLPPGPQCLGRHLVGRLLNSSELSWLNSSQLKTMVKKFVFF